MNQPLHGRTIAIPETRELDLFAQMLERRGAATVRCPLISILDAPDPAPVRDWLQRFCSGGCDDLILLTGEGLRRLLDFAVRENMRDVFITSLARARLITRGPKPARALKDLDLKPHISADAPTTDGVIAALARLDLRGRRVGVQLYGTEPNERLMEFLRNAGATPDAVAPYVYASKAADAQVIRLIERLAAGEIDVIAFTSAAQITRVWQVAEEAKVSETLAVGLTRTRIAAVGPIVADALRARGARVDMMPMESYFMKPLVNAIVAAIGKD